MSHVLQQQYREGIERVDITAGGVQRSDPWKKTCFRVGKTDTEGVVLNGSVHGQMLPEMLPVSLAPAAWT